MRKIKISHLGAIEVVKNEKGSILLRTLIFTTLLLLIVSGISAVYSFSIKRASELQEKIEILIEKENIRVFHEIQ